MWKMYGNNDGNYAGGRASGWNQRRQMPLDNEEQSNLDSGDGSYTGRGPDSSSQRHQMPLHNEEQPNQVGTGQGYQRIDPRGDKRQQLLQAYEQGEKMYEQYRQKSRLGYVSECSKLGGGSVSEQDARKRAQQQQQQAKFDRLRKEEQRKAQKKQLEEEENAKMKAEARRKAEQLEFRKRQQEEKAKKHCDEEYRRTNLKFLDRLQQQTMQSAQLSASQTVSSSGVQSNVSDVQPAAGDGVSQPFSGLDEQTTTNCTGTPRVQHSQTGPLAIHQSAADQQWATVHELQCEFPHYDADILNDLLQQVNYSITAARQLLSYN